MGCSKVSEVTETKTKASEEGTGTEPKSVTLLYSFAPGSLDPHTESITVRAGITETLVKIDENLEIKPWLAESWEQIDGKTWRFKVREGVTFHDGLPVDGEAVKASFERAIEVSKALQSLLKIESIEADGQQVTFKTTDEYPAFISELVHTNASVIQVNAENIEHAPIGTGPFKVTSYIQDVQIQLERFEGYWDGVAKLEKATVKFNSDGNVRSLSLQSKDADIAYHIPTESIEIIEKSDFLRIESIPSLRAHFILYNNNKATMKDVKVRQALDMLINRPVIAKDLMNGHATEANGPFNKNLPFGSPKEITAFDPDKAKALLEEAGYHLNAKGLMEKDGQTLSLKLATYQGRPELPLMAQYLLAEASLVGIEIDIVVVENVDSYLFENQDEWDMVTYSILTTPRGDGGYFFNVAYLPAASLNPGQIDNPELTSLIEVLNTTSDQFTRNELKSRGVEIIQEQVPQSFIVYPHIVVGVNERVINWKPGAEEYYLLTNTLDVK
ncbi:ABC transporter substrate-binding protein [Anaerobacillus sp. CMMVII]|nr:ABC transporter substrate-binding protein [Anaerobacillus sp. CMMVII]